MKILSFRNIVLTLSFFLLVSFSSYAGKKTYGDVEVTEVVRVYDGDTITVNIAGFPDIIGEEIGIRVLGVDTPEIRDKNQMIKEFAKYVRDCVKDFLKGSNKIFLCDMKRDKYFRIVADVIVDNESLGVKLIEAGFAKPYDGGKKNQWKVEDIPSEPLKSLDQKLDISSESLNRPDQK